MAADRFAWILVATLVLAPARAASAGVEGGPAAVPARKAPCEVQFDGQRVTARGSGATIAETMAELARATAMDVRWVAEPGSDPIDVGFAGVPLREAVSRLLSNYNYVLVSPGPDRGRIRIGSSRDWLAPSPVADGGPGGPSFGLPAAPAFQRSAGWASRAANGEGGAVGGSAGGGRGGGSLGGSGGRVNGGGAGATGDAGSESSGDSTVPALGPISPLPATTEKPRGRPVAGDLLLVRDAAAETETSSIEVVLLADADDVPDADSDADPTREGGRLKLRNPETGERDVYGLPAEGWTWSSAGYVYDDPDAEAGPCTRIAIDQDGRITASCAGEEVEFTLDEEVQGELLVDLELGDGAGSVRLCAIFGGIVRTDVSTATADGIGLFHAIDAPAPSSCPRRS
jgi:hypothetical protein